MKNLGFSKKNVGSFGYVDSSNPEYKSGLYKISSVRSKFIALEDKNMPFFNRNNGVSEYGTSVMLYPSYNMFQNEKNRLYNYDLITERLRISYIRDNITTEQLSEISSVLDKIKEGENS